MALPKQLRFVLVSPEKTLFDELVDALQFPLFDGQIGILPGRAPLVGRLGYGPLKISQGTSEKIYFIDGGFVQVKGGVVTILTNQAIPAEKIDAATVEEQLRKTNARVPTKPEEFAAKARDLERTRKMLHVAHQR